MNREDKYEETTEVKFYPIIIGSSKFNVNRSPDEMLTMDDFEETLPEMSEENGPHLRFNTSNANPKIIPINDSVASRLIIENSDKMTDDEFFSTFVDKRKELVKDIINKTYAIGYEKPSSVQALCVAELILGRDCMVQAKSGTGKTFTFLSGLLWHFDPDNDSLQNIFITSSHEVASQIYKHAKTLLPEGARISLCIGQGQRRTQTDTNRGGFKSQPVRTSDLSLPKPKSIRQEKAEVEKAQVIVGTMGRIYDFITNASRRCINVATLKAICVDEFDTIVSTRSKSGNSVSMTTEDQITEIIEMLPLTTQRAFFSATVNGDALYISRSFFRPYDRLVGREFLSLLDVDDYTLDGIRHYYVTATDNSEKKDILLDLLQNCRINQGIIFVNKIETAEKLKNELDNQDVPYPTNIFHGGLNASERATVHDNLIGNKIRLLISTDLSSRGLDIQGINVVFNYDMPDSVETYIHRVGRSGRFGRKGTAINLIISNTHHDEMIKVAEVNEHSKKNPMEHLPDNLATLL